MNTCAGLFSLEKESPAGLKAFVLHLLLNAEKREGFFLDKIFVSQVFQEFSPGLLILVYFGVSFKNKVVFLPFIKQALTVEGFLQLLTSYTDTEQHSSLM